MLAVNDLFYLATPVITSLFLEDVTAWLDLHRIRYIPQVKFTGKSGLDHRFDFAIPKSERKPERLIRTLNRINRETVESVAFSWIDTKDSRSAESQVFAILNDANQQPRSSVIDALKSYSIEPVLWSERERFKDELVV